MLQVEHLTKRFKLDNGTVQTVLDDVSCAVRPGEAVAIVGRSGSGKTTLIKAIAGFTSVDAGRIIFGGKDITHAHGHAQREVYKDMQMVFQSPAASFDPRLTLGSSISEHLRNLGIKKSERTELVKNLLEQCSLPPEFISRYPHEVSGGQCQRAAIARALTAEPKLLLCDEATSALDVTAQAQMIFLLERLKRERGMAILFVCHNLAVAQSLCDKIIVMHSGTVAESGTSDEVINHPKSEYTKQLLDAVL